MKDEGCNPMHDGLGIITMGPLCKDAQYCTVSCEKEASVKFVAAFKIPTVNQRRDSPEKDAPEM